MNTPSDAICRVVVSICSDLDTPISRLVIKNIQEKRWKDLAEMRVLPSDYDCAEKYRKDVVATSLLRKLPMPTGIDTAEAAKATWEKCEKQCKQTNRRFSALLNKEAYPLAADLEDPYLQAQLRLLRCVRKWVKRFVGPVPKRIQGRPSKKATYELRRADASIIDKFALSPAFTPNVLDSLNVLDFEDTAWNRGLSGNLFLDGPPTSDSLFHLSKVVPGNRFSTVPKDGQTDRPIACEPTLNVYAQLGIGGVLKRRLRRFGLLATKDTCNFESQEWHRRLAHKASIDGSLSTVDLSSASDTVALGVVQALMPSGWFELLCGFRSPRTVSSTGKKTQVFFLEKLSSMGNGFTFEVETAIFAAIAAAATELSGIEPRVPHNVSVYGDDIIVPTEASKLLLNCLSFFGFTPNTKKSFTEGPFRESCGGDYWRGEDVRPIFIEKDPQDPIDWFSLHNKIYRLRKHLRVSVEALEICRAQVPIKIRECYGPESLGDIVLHSEDRDLYRQKTVWETDQKKPSGYRVLQVILPVVPSRLRSRWDPQTELVAALFGIGTCIPLWDPDSPDRLGRGYRTTWIPWG